MNVTLRQEGYSAMMKSKVFVFGLIHLLLVSGIALAANPVIKDKKTGMELVLVKGGCYQMGDIFSDGKKNETPVHEACVKDFYMGKFEVTQEQWLKVMGENPSQFSACGKNCPVDSVSWDMAQEFVKKLNAMTRKNFRLPTDAEFEYAARSGGKKEKWPGTNSETDLEEYAWFAKNSEETTHPVGLKKPNGLGLYDMAGNVREWCQDWYDVSYYSKSPKNSPESTEPYVLDPEAENPRTRSERGGGWDSTSFQNRPVNRSHNAPDYNYEAFGLRVVLPVKK
jgi:formylglycine-generating enzyme required for sulfatase activity